VCTCRIPTSSTLYGLEGVRMDCFPVNGKGLLLLLGGRFLRFMCNEQPHVGDGIDRTFPVT